MLKVSRKEMRDTVLPKVGKRDTMLPKVSRKERIATVLSKVGKKGKIQC